MKPERLFPIASSPHVHSGNRIDTAMRDVILALLPACLGALWFFGGRVALLLFAAILTALLSEAACQKIRGLPVTIADYSAALTGILLTMTVPVTTPVWVVVIGSASAVVLGKQLFGGLGNNLFNPALVGRIVIGASWPLGISHYVRPYDAVTTATPLALLGEAVSHPAGPAGGDIVLPSLQALFTGSIAGSLGETSALLLLAGGIFLVWRHHIDMRIPLFYIGSVFFLALLFPAGGDRLWFATFSILSGGLFLGAIYMATDWVTSPVTYRGRLLYALGLGILTFLIRRGGGPPEGVAYSILLMNMATPLLDRYTRRKVFGAVKKNG